MNRQQAGIGDDSPLATDVGCGQHYGHMSTAAPFARRKTGHTPSPYPMNEMPRFDWVGPLCMVLLGITGVFFIHSAQAYTGGNAWKKQIVWLFLGGGVYTVVSLIRYPLWMAQAHLIYYASLVLLLMLTLSAPPFGLPLLGVERFNAWRWLDLKFLVFQPSEAAKIGVLVMVSSLLARSQVGTIRESLVALGKVALVVLVPFALIFRQPDLGSCLVFLPMVFSLLYVSKLSERFFAIVFGLFLVGLGLVSIDLYRYQSFLEENGLSALDDRGKYEVTSWMPLKDYQRNRILAFVLPELVDPSGTGVSWNKLQSEISVGSGGLLGKGHGEGTQAKLGYLPPAVAHNDFIFSVLAEEKGFVGSLFVVGLFCILIINGIRIAAEAQDRFGRLLAVGVSVIFLVHVFINIGMTIGLMPITGLPLPFMSYGGSFVLSCCILQGFVQSVFRYRRDFAEGNLTPR